MCRRARRGRRGRPSAALTSWRFGTGAGAGRNRSDARNEQGGKAYVLLLQGTPDGGRGPQAPRRRGAQAPRGAGQEEREGARQRGARAGKGLARSPKRRSKV